jgi:hypothetical protein
LSHAAFFERLALPGTKRLELRVALLEILEFSGRDGRTNAKARRPGDLTGIGFGIGDEFRYGLDPKRWADPEDNGMLVSLATPAMSRMKLKSSFS